MPSCTDCTGECTISHACSACCVHSHAHPCRLPTTCTMPAHTSCTRVLHLPPAHTSSLVACICAHILADRTLRLPCPAAMAVRAPGGTYLQPTNARLIGYICVCASLQIAHYVCHALLQWLRAHLVAHTSSLRRPSRARPRPLDPNAPAAHAHAQPLSYKPVGDVGQEAMDALLWTLDVDRRLQEAFIRAPWPAMEVGGREGVNMLCVL